jgi:hypothetical protein
LHCGDAIAPNEGRLRQEYEKTKDKSWNRTGKISTGKAEGHAEQQRHTECCDKSTHEPTFRHDWIIADDKTVLKQFSKALESRISAETLVSQMTGLDAQAVRTALEGQRFKPTRNSR